jgi:Motility quorum-sensing regulator, toxin of MqsA
MGGPVHDPQKVQGLASNEATRAITLSAEDGCYELELTLEDVWAAMADLSGPNCRYYKSMPSDKRPEDIFDVYEVFIGAHAIYLKFKIVNRSSGSVLVVVSFKRNEHYK